MLKKNNLKILLFFYLISLIFLSGCDKSEIVNQQKSRVFFTSFESIADFNSFYLVPQGDFDSNHELVTDNVHSGNYSHKATILKARSKNNDGKTYLPHRAYPTIQLYKTKEGSYTTPCLVTFWVFLDINLSDRPNGEIDDWFSFATLTPDKSDSWERTILLNIVHDGYLRLVHVPNQGQQEHIFQVNIDNDNEGLLLFPNNEWVKIDIYIDLNSTNGYAKVWQNNKLVSHALVNGGKGTLEQAHFGLYASSAISSGVVYNDDLTIREVKNEEDAMKYINN